MLRTLLNYYYRLAPAALILAGVFYGNLAFSQTPSPHEALSADEAMLVDIANDYYKAISEISMRTPLPDDAYRFQDFAHKAAKKIVSGAKFVKIKARLFSREHDELLAIKAFLDMTKYGVVYPYIAHEGHAWMIPLLNVTLMNSEAVLGGVYLAQKWIKNRKTQHAFGKTLTELNDIQDEVLNLKLSELVRQHEIVWEGEPTLLPVRSRIVRDFVPIVRERIADSNVITSHELEKMINDEAFLFQAKELRFDPALYEEVLIRKIFDTPAALEKLAERMKGFEPVAATHTRNLLVAIAKLDQRIDSFGLMQAEKLSSFFKKDLKIKVPLLNFSVLKVKRSLKLKRKELLTDIEKLEELRLQILAEKIDAAGANLKLAQLQDEVDRRLKSLTQEYQKVLECKSKEDLKRLAASFSKSHRCALELVW